MANIMIFQVKRVLYLFLTSGFRCSRCTPTSMLMYEKKASHYCNAQPLILAGYMLSGISG